MEEEMVYRNGCPSFKKIFLSLSILNVLSELATGDLSKLLIGIGSAFPKGIEAKKKRTNGKNNLFILFLSKIGEQSYFSFIFIWVIEKILIICLFTLMKAIYLCAKMMNY
jgi:hypothetical protein